MDFERASGVLLHLSSLPNGRLDRHAYAFVDWLAEAGQSWWQVLPLGPPDRHGSPYRAVSAFAAWSGFLARPRARARRGEIDGFRERHLWAESWERIAGPGALADQVRFEREWVSLRRHAAARGIRLLGDLPIYVAPGSADVRLRPELFRDDAVAGVPPDSFSEDGQLWGNPLYDWPANRRAGYRWWTERFRRSFGLFDATRIDHFRGFVAYWTVPRGSRTAAEGHWSRGPGAAPFERARAELGPLPLVAEDLGVITEPVVRLREQLGLPGMAVIQFGFDGDPGNPHALENHSERCVVYTGTHDHSPIAGWYRSLRERERRRIPGFDGSPHWALIRLALSSRAQLAIVQAQDVLGLGEQARMNTPGGTRGNWRWRLRPGQLTREHARALRTFTEQSARIAPADGQLWH